LKSNRAEGDIRNRRFAIYILFTAVFILLLVWKFFDVMILNPVRTGPGTISPPLVERGPILDRNGKILAVQTRLHSVTAWMPHVYEPAQTASLLSDILGIDSTDTLERMVESRGFLYIKRKISPSESSAVQQLIDEGRLPGIGLDPEFGRNYPEKNLASHVIGFVGTDNIGLEGIELTYDNVLSPPPGPAAQTGESYGNQLFLTLDVNVQFFAEALAKKAWDEYRPDNVMIMVMDAQNGDFLAWTALPSYDPNNFSRASDLKKQNRPVTAAYEPGSVFKVFSIASFMELGGITPSSAFYCDGSYEKTFPLSGETIVISDLAAHGTVHAREILKYSCNSGAAYASETVSKEDFYKQLTSFGFGSPVHLPFPGESSGILRKPGTWSGRTKPTIAIGQEIAVSAVQIMAGATSFTNDGMVLEPHIVKKILTPEGRTLERFDRTPIRQVLQPEIAEAVLLMMESASESGGTGRRAAIEEMRMSIKTGTGEKIDPETGRYSLAAVTASALAIFPTNDPKFIIYIVIEHPRGEEYFGGRIAAPIVKELGEELIRYYGLPDPEDQVIQHDGTIRVGTLPEITLEERMPDLTGYPKRDLLPLLEDPRFSVQIDGSGWVSEQDPPPGSALKEGAAIRLFLE
jgi:cell division protein FtsI (penicillin-binding protein 3)